jgi:hypothetical protein
VNLNRTALPLHLPVDACYALKTGLAVEKICGINIKYRNIFFISLFYIPIRLVTWWNTTHKEIFLARSGYGTPVNTWMTNFHVLAAERLPLVLKKTTIVQQIRKTPHISWYKKS